MSANKHILFLVSAILLLSCGRYEPPVTFDEAQPANTNAISAFPGSVCGEYAAVDGASILTVSGNIVTRTHDYEVKTVKDSIVPPLYLKSDTIFISGYPDSVFAANVKIYGDSLVINVHYMDTLFMLTDSSALKKFKGYYFLNERYAIDNSKYTWGVRKLSVIKGVLTLTQIGSQKDLNDLREITETDDTTVSSFAPTRRQFKQFLRYQDDEMTEQFTRIKR